MGRNSYKDDDAFHIDDMRVAEFLIKYLESNVRITIEKIDKAK